MKDGCLGTCLLENGELLTISEQERDCIKALLEEASYDSSHMRDCKEDAARSKEALGKAHRASEVVLGRKSWKRGWDSQLAILHCMEGMQDTKQKIIAAPHIALKKKKRLLPEILELM